MQTGEAVMSFRSFLYALARLLGDINAIQKGTVGKRVQRRVVGRLAGKLLVRVLK